MKFIGFYNYTVILTYISFISGIIGMKLAFEGRTGMAICCLMVSGVCDMFDGVVARTKKNQKTTLKRNPSAGFLLRISSTAKSVS